ncbi:stalk domain-containing protein [Paenibacillus solisilvae]|uniref:Stalk domain-containing protein n=1 Tax=Paenibacillus solisilvae TaxID=2486751 RepID=A0ABW0W7D9_9BACL
MYSNFRKSPRLAAALTAAAILAAAVGAGSAAASGNAAPIVKSSLFSAINYVPYAAVPAAIEAADTQHIVAVGDSLTVGYELGMTENSTPYGYADRVYEQALYHGRAELQNYGILGLKSTGLEHWLGAVISGTSTTAEEVQPNLSSYPLASETIAKSANLRSALEQADTVVLTIGGNDFTSIFEEIKASPMTAEQLSSRLDTMLTDYNVSLESSLRAILSINPKVQIVFADQYLPVPKPSAINKAVTAEQYAVLVAAVKKLQEQDEALAVKLRQEGNHVKMVDVSAPFMGNELSYTYILRGDIHPKQSGYEQMGKAFAKGIWSDYKEPAVLPAGVPLRIVVNGRTLSGANKPIVKNSTTFLPMRDIADAMNANLSWDNKTRTATLKSGDKQVSFTIGAKTMQINGQTAPLETPAYLQKVGNQSVTYLPLAALSKGLGYQVIYRKPIQTVFVNK